MILQPITPDPALKCAFSHAEPAAFRGTFEFSSKRGQTRLLCSEHAHAAVKAMPKSFGFIN